MAFTEDLVAWHDLHEALVLAVGLPPTRTDPASDTPRQTHVREAWRVLQTLAKSDEPLSSRQVQLLAELVAAVSLAAKD